MKIAVYPGSFDPITNGHRDIIERASKVFDKVIVAVLVNPSKNGLFTCNERIVLINKVVREFDNVEVCSFDGLLVNFMKERNAQVIIKGLRAVSDFEYEFQMALMNNKLSKQIETLFMMANQKYLYISSSVVKQIATFKGPIDDLVPDEIIEDIKRKYDY